jgi:NAD(P)-dependent dehydrogenase (short-subunit alcohol dehydrogenase family)
MNQFAGKVAFVTGAANGIGRAAALAFACETEQAWRDQYWSRIKAYLDRDAG